MSNELAKKEPTEMQVALIEIVKRKDIDPERLEKFLDLQIKMEERQASVEFQKALAGFQSECPVIDKSKKVDFNAKSGSRVKYDYSPLDDMAEAIKPHLKQWGLAYRFKLKRTDDINLMNLVTVISHKGGHTEESDYFFTRLHNDHKMNESQQAKSAIIYTKRAALENALGIVTGGQDDDGRGSVQKISDSQIKDIKELLVTLNKEDRPFLEYCSKVFRREIEYISDMNGAEAAEVIVFLKDLKTNQDKK